MQRPHVYEFGSYWAPINIKNQMLGWKFRHEQVQRMNKLLFDLLFHTQTTV